MPFRATFDCLWCGTPHACRAPDDLEGWAHLCPTCIGKAGDNGFLRFRLRQAITERGQASDQTAKVAGPASAPSPVAATTTTNDADASAAETDDWYLRRGRFALGAVHDAAWHAELDAAGRWLDLQPVRGDIVDLAAGTGWWATLLAGKGELSLYDANAAALERARERLVAHGLRAHLHVRDAWAEPDRTVDAVFLGFGLGHLPPDRIGPFLALVRRWLKPDGRFIVIDALADPYAGIVVEFAHPPTELEAALLEAGFTSAGVTTTGRFFLTALAMTGPI